ncbi:MAG TPA: FMN-binding negative transcriptional regulator [Usitatibacter sp.]|nr:FMN-binding negative transcriptional regulator [Usitatibacter sp.]
MTLYVPTHFRVDDREALLAFMQRYAFGTLVSAGPQGFHVSHIPFVPELNPDGSIRIFGHVARANPQWQGLEEAQHVVAIFQGPHAYVSPSWYAQHPSVPTWNYAVVHAEGKPRLLDEEGLRELLSRLSSIYESGRPSPWQMARLPGDYLSKMLTAIVGFVIEVERLEGKFKLSQNRPAEVSRVAQALEAEGEAKLAALMREHSPQRKE